jgi:hypothetical protein
LQFRTNLCGQSRRNGINCARQAGFQLARGTRVMMGLHGQAMISIKFAGKPGVEAFEKPGARILVGVCYVLHKF